MRVRIQTDEEKICLTVLSASEILLILQYTSENESY